MCNATSLTLTLSFQGRGNFSALPSTGRLSILSAAAGDVGGLGGSDYFGRAPERFFLVFELEVVDATVEAVVLDQLLMATALYDLAVIENNDFVGAHDSVKALSDYKGSPALHE